MREALVWLVCSSCILFGWLLYAKATERSAILPENTHADLVVIRKNTHYLTLYNKGQVLKSYRVALGSNPVGHKEREGDNKTPEGTYIIDSRKSDSAFHKALHISYPNALDIEKAKRLGVSPGGAIMIHGIRNGLGWIGNFHRYFDWTSGCIAVTDWEIEEIWRVVPDGVSVRIES